MIVFEQGIGTREEEQRRIPEAHKIALKRLQPQRPRYCRNGDPEQDERPVDIKAAILRFAELALHLRAEIGLKQTFNAHKRNGEIHEPHQKHDPERGANEKGIHPGEHFAVESQRLIAAFEGIPDGPCNAQRVEAKLHEGLPAKFTAGLPTEYRRGACPAAPIGQNVIDDEDDHQGDHRPAKDARRRGHRRLPGVFLA